MATFCPACAQDFRPQPEKKCHQRPQCKLPVADLVGHDRLGHSLSRQLQRAGYRTVREVMDLADEGDLDLFLGEKACGRVAGVLRS